MQADCFFRGGSMLKMKKLRAPQALSNQSPRSVLRMCLIIACFILHPLLALSCHYQSFYQMCVQRCRWPLIFFCLRVCCSFFWLFDLWPSLLLSHHSGRLVEYFLFPAYFAEHFWRASPSFALPHLADLSYMCSDRSLLSKKHIFRNSIGAFLQPECTAHCGKYCGFPAPGCFWSWLKECKWSCFVWCFGMSKCMAWLFLISFVFSLFEGITGLLERRLQRVAECAIWTISKETR